MDTERDAPLVLAVWRDASAVSFPSGQERRRRRSHKLPRNDSESRPLYGERKFEFTSQGVFDAVSPQRMGVMQHAFYRLLRCWCTISTGVHMHVSMKFSFPKVYVVRRRRPRQKTGSLSRPPADGRVGPGGPDRESRLCPAGRRPHSLPRRLSALVTSVVTRSRRCRYRSAADDDLGRWRRAAARGER